MAVTPRDGLLTLTLPDIDVGGISKVFPFVDQFRAPRDQKTARILSRTFVASGISEDEWGRAVSMASLVPASGLRSEAGKHATAAAELFWEKASDAKATLDDSWKLRVMDLVQKGLKSVATETSGTVAKRVTFLAKFTLVLGLAKLVTISDDAEGVVAGIVKAVANLFCNLDSKVPGHLLLVLFLTVKPSVDAAAPAAAAAAPATGAGAAGAPIAAVGAGVVVGLLNADLIKRALIDCNKTVQNVLCLVKRFWTAQLVPPDPLHVRTADWYMRS